MALLHADEGMGTFNPWQEPQAHSDLEQPVRRHKTSGLGRMGEGVDRRFVGSEGDARQVGDEERKEDAMGPLLA